MQMLVFQNLVYIKTLPFAIQLHPNDPIKGGTSRQKKTDCLLKTIGFLYLWRRSREKLLLIRNMLLFKHFVVNKKKVLYRIL